MQLVDTVNENIGSKCTINNFEIRFILKIRRVLNVVFFLLGDSAASEFYMLTFRDTVCSRFIGGVSLHHL